MPPETEEKKRTTAAWLGQHARTMARLNLLGGVLLIPLSLLAHFVTYCAFWVMFGLKLRPLLGWNLDTASLAAWVAVALLHPLYRFTNREALHRVELDPRRHRVGAWMVGHATGNPLLTVFAGPKTLMTFARMLAQFLLVAPATAWTAVRLLVRAARWSRLDIDDVAPLVHSLLKADGRVPLVELIEDRLDNADGARQTLDRLLLLDGILLLTKGPPGLSLGSELRAEIVAWKRAGLGE